MLGQPPASHGEAERARSRAKVTLSRFFLCPTSFARIVSGAPTLFYARVSQSYPGAADCTLGAGGVARPKADVLKG